MLQNKKILIISPEDFGVVFLSKHHYAEELSKKNKVWFLNAKGNRRQKKLIEISNEDSNLNIVSYFNLFFGFGKIPFWLTKLINNFLSTRIRRAMGDVDIVWTFEQSKFFDLDLFGAKHKIFHPVDYIDQFHFEKKLISDSADIIFSVTDEILNTLVTSTPKHFINHGVQISNSCQQANLSIDRQKVNIGYVGNINSPYLDIKNLLKAVELNNDAMFHFIGPYESSNLGQIKSSNNYESLKRCKNVVFHGVISKPILVNTLKKFDILISCYNNSKDPIRLSNSHKILEYFGTGKIIVSNYFPVYKSIDREIICLVEDNSMFGERVQEVSGKLEFYNEIEKQKVRLVLAKENSYSNQIKRIEELLDNQLK